MVRLTMLSLRCPIAWPIKIVEAIPKPNTKEININIKILPFAVAANASSPRDWPTQIALIEPFNDCSADDPSVGNANKSIVLGIDPLVRSRRLWVAVAALLNVYPCALLMIDETKTLIINQKAGAVFIRAVTLGNLYDYLPVIFLGDCRAIYREV